MGADGFSYLGSEAHLERAANGLADRSPRLSARDGLTSAQKICGVISLVSLVYLTLQAPQIVYWGAYIFFAIMIVWRACLVTIALRSQSSTPRQMLPDTALPSYSVLVALYDEAPSVPGLISALTRLSYPTHRLDIHLLLEESDTATLAALEALTIPGHVHIHRLAAGTPQTKPRALNYGLEFCAGDYVTIFDAEDRPHPDQLRCAATRFKASSPEVACLQAPLTAHNSSESWIASQWGLEYDIQFGLLLPALARSGCPIPLGGTSNHFRRDALEAAGGWDAWNVTEDADLGLRLARMGKRVGVISPPTLEEAPETFQVWMAQRSRWIKGFIQSWLVLMRTPLQSLREIGIMGWLAMQLTLGGAILSAMLAGPMAIWLSLCVFLPDLELGAAGIALLLSGYGVNVLAAFVSPNIAGAERLKTVATLPLYWPLLSIATVRALYGLARTPHFWAKTPHGLTAAQLDESLQIALPRLDSHAHSADQLSVTHRLRKLEGKPPLG